MARRDVLASLLARCDEEKKGERRGEKRGGCLLILKKKNSGINQREMFVMGKRGLYKSIRLYAANSSQERAGESEPFMCISLRLPGSFIWKRCSVLWQPRFSTLFGSCSSHLQIPAESVVRVPMHLFLDTGFSMAFGGTESQTRKDRKSDSNSGRAESGSNALEGTRRGCWRLRSEKAFKGSLSG